MPGVDALAIIEAIYAAVADPALWSAALDAIAKGLGSSRAALSLVDHALASGAFCAHQVVNDALLGLRPKGCAANDPWIDAVERLAARTIAETVQRRGVDHLEADLDRLGNADDALPDLLTLQRSGAGDRRMTAPRRVEPIEDDGGLHDVIATHLSRALRLRQIQVQSAALAQALAEPLDSLLVGTVVVDRSGKVVHLNRLAQAMIDDRDGIGISASGGIQALHRDDEGLLAQLLHKVVKGGGQAATARIRRADGKPPFLALAMPVREDAQRGASAGAGEMPAAMLLIRDAGSINAAIERLLRHRFRLSAGEARVVSLLTAGRSVAECAADLNCSIAVVRFHLRGTFRKTGVDSQGKLISQVLHEFMAFGPLMHYRPAGALED